MAAQIAEPTEQDPPVEETPDSEVQVSTPRGVLAIDPLQAAFTPPQLALLQALGVQTSGPEAIPPNMLTLGLYRCQALGLDPFIDVAFMRTDTGIALITKIEGFRKIAERTQEYAGQTRPMWLDAEGQEYPAYPAALGRPYGATIGVHRRGFIEPLYGTVYTHEVEVFQMQTVRKTVRGKTVETKERVLAPSWQDRNGVLRMVVKCARAAAFREAFPSETSGLYIPEEMERLRQERRDAERIRAEAAGREARRAAFDAAKADDPDAPPRVEVEREVIDLADHLPPRRSRAESAAAAAGLRDRVQARAAAAAAVEPEPVVEEEPEPAEEAPVVARSAEDEATLAREELAEQALILGVPPATLTRRMETALGRGPDDWTVDDFRAVIEPLRPAVAARLRSLCRNEEAAAYSEVRPGDLDDVAHLFGRA